ncbi:MAG: hypothetical protein KC478_15230, partial [Bacteriovoracaceae bacterium]|nr:hypothetical protein [Bacteriovoracaceae bacterium]
SLGDKMKNTYILIMLVGFITSCSSYQGNRGIANIEKLEIYQVGEIKTSLLESDEFQDKYGKSWVLMDGRDVAGSEFSSLTAMTKLPDARGKFLRMVNNGASGGSFDADGDRTLGSFQNDTFKTHVHGIHGKDSGGYAYGNPSFRSDINGGAPDRSKSTHSTGNAETRPKNIGVNFYVKIRSCSEEDGVCL